MVCRGRCVVHRCSICRSCVGLSFTRVATSGGRGVDSLSRVGDFGDVAVVARNGRLRGALMDGRTPILGDLSLACSLLHYSHTYSHHKYPETPISMLENIKYSFLNLISYCPHDVTPSIILVSCPIRGLSLKTSCMFICIQDISRSCGVVSLFVFNK